MDNCENVRSILVNNSASYNFSAKDFHHIFGEYCNNTEDSNFISEINTVTAVTMTTVYVILLVSGVTGNSFTCAVIARNRYMHTATNCYLFSLAMSDLLLLVTGIPHEIHTLWVPQPPYSLGEIICVFRGFTAETSTYASVLTITFFTVERYLAICHPLKAQAMSEPSRTVKCASLVWLVAATSALPIALQFGLIYQKSEDGEILPQSSLCALKSPIRYAFLISALMFFLFPLLLIFVLYLKIGLKLSKPMHIHRSRRNIDATNEKHSNNRKGIVKMLVAVVVCFFLCWSPFHAQSLMAIYVRAPTPLLDTIFHLLHQISGISYYLSATLDPILYHLMSKRFRKAFCDTFCFNRNNETRTTIATTFECSGSQVCKSTVVSLRVMKS